MAPWCSLRWPINGNVTVSDFLATVCFLLATVAVGYTILSAFCLNRFLAAEPTDHAARNAPAITVLKPLKGTHPGLLEDLESFLLQDYAGPLQLIIGLHDAADPAAAVVEALRRRHPEADLSVVVDATLHGANRKVSNLINMLAHARHPVIAIADSDIRLDPSDLAIAAARLDRDGVGMATCLYLGHPRGGFWSQAAALAVDHHFVPNVAVGVRLRLAEPAFGALTVLSAATLERVGGFRAFKDVLADDYALGAAVRRLGLAVEIPPRLVLHTAAERSLGDVLSHELRWARTIRGVDPVGFAGSVVTHAVPLALIAMLAGGVSGPTAALLAAALASRLAVQAQVPDDPRRVPRLRRYGMGPFRDLLSFAVFAASYFTSSVDWAGVRLGVRTDGSIAEEGGR